MRSTGEHSAGDLQGDKLYEQRARVALPVLVRQAKTGQTIRYGDLASELGMPNPRNLNYVLAAIGNSLLDLGDKWGCKVPPIQALVVNKSTQLPGEGISWFAPDAAQFKVASASQRQLIVKAMLTEVFTYRRWDEVLGAYGLEGPPPPVTALPPVEAVAAGGGGPEGQAHLELKEAIAAHPEWLGLPTTLAPGKTEVALYSGDRVDVVFSDKGHRVAVEVKAADAPESELVRGLFQCVKYAAVLDAEARAALADTDCRAILALGDALPLAYMGLRAALGVEVREGVGAGKP